MKTNLLNKKAVREFILAEVRTYRPGWNCSRVSAEVLLLLEAKLQKSIHRAVQMHPSSGHTFRSIL